MALVYVDKERIVGIASPVLGSSLSRSEEVVVEGGFVWFIQANASVTNGKQVVTQIKDLLPETVATELLKCFNEDLVFENVENCIRKIVEWHGDPETKANLIGKALIVRGNLHICGLDDASVHFDPRNTPSNKDVSSFLYNGRECIAAMLEGDEISLPIYFPLDSLSMISYGNLKSVTVVGSLGFSGWHETRVGNINVVLCGAALWVN